MKIKLLIIALSSVTSSYALSVDTNVSTLGLGLGVTQHIIGDLYIKANYNNLNAQINFIQSNFDINMRNFGLLLSYNVWNNLYVDAGMYNTIGFIKQTTTQTASYMGVNGSVSTVNKVDINGTNPYFGFSYKSNNDKGFYVGTSVGILLLKNQSNTDYTITASNYTQIGSTNPETTLLPYPVISVGVGYNF
jgi:hypothetical protein